MTRADMCLGTQGRRGKMRNVIPADRESRSNASRALSIRDDLPPRLRTIVNAVNGVHLFTDVILYDGEPQVMMRAYLRGDLRKAPPRELRAIIEQGRELADGELWQGRHLQIRRVESYLEVYPEGVEMLPPFRREEAHALSGAVVLRHDRKVLAAAIEKGDPRYLALLAGDLSAASKMIEWNIGNFKYFLKEKASRERDIAEYQALLRRWKMLKTGKSKLSPAESKELAKLNADLPFHSGQHSLRPSTELRFRRHFYDGLDQWFTLPELSSDPDFLNRQSIESLISELDKALPVYERYTHEVEQALEQRFLGDDRNLSFALFLARLSAADAYVESDYAPSSVSLRPEQPGLPYEAYQKKIAHWSRRYLEIFPG